MSIITLTVAALALLGLYRTEMRLRRLEEFVTRMDAAGSRAILGGRGKTSH